jgi:glycosyltransferase involved in cell wall biosynthesis
MMNPLVSVVVPNYNHAAYLQQRIDSILNQTYTNIELILLDDCSSDDSKLIIESYRSHKAVAHIVYNEQNSGTTFKQWDRGINLARGEWIWIAESDDWCEPTLLETLIEGIAHDTCISYCQSILCYSSGDIWAPVRTHRYSQSYVGNEFMKTQMLFELPIYNASMTIFKKSIFHSIDKEFTTYKFCGDWLFWILAARHGNITVSGKYLNYFRKHDKDVSGKAYKEGLFYTEYVKIMSYLVNQSLVTVEEKQSLMLQKYAKFIDDKQLNPQFMIHIKAQLLKETGNYFYSTFAYRCLGFRKYISALLFKIKQRE